MQYVADDNLTDAGREWARRAQAPLDALGLAFLVALLLLWSFPAAPEPFLRVVNAVIGLVWLTFAIDYVARVWLSIDRVRFIRTHRLDLLMVVLPMLRLLRVALVMRRALSNVSTEKIAGSIVSIVVVVVVTSAFLMWRVEYDAPGATITTFRNAMWWAVVTTTTVGYGDYTPVTQAGRIIAMTLMLVGIGLIGTVSATVAAWFVTRASERVPRDQAAGEAEAETTPEVSDQQAVAHAELVARLDLLAMQQAELRTLILKSQGPGRP